jgi:hypothetical protein
MLNGGSNGQWISSLASAAALNMIFYNMNSFVWHRNVFLCFPITKDLKNTFYHNEGVRFKHRYCWSWSPMGLTKRDQVHLAYPEAAPQSRSSGSRCSAYKEGTRAKVCCLREKYLNQRVRSPKARNDGCTTVGHHHTFLDAGAASGSSLTASSRVCVSPHLYDELRL